MAIFPDPSCVKPGNIGPFSSGDESVVLKRNGPQKNLKKTCSLKRTENNLVMIIYVIYLRLPTIPWVAKKKWKFIYCSSHLGDNYVTPNGKHHSHYFILAFISSKLLLTHALRCLERLSLSSVDYLHLIFSEIFERQNAITMHIWSVLFSKESIWSML